jgi:uncharacterized membrane protein YoaK (UPF0700 family)
MKLFPVLLSLIAGSTDVISLLGLGLFSAHVTGNLVILTARLVTRRADNTCLFLSVPIFVLGLSLTGLLSAALQARRINPLRPLLLLQFLMLGGSLVVWRASGHPAAPEVPGVIVAGQLCVAAMAVQNALVALSLHGSPTTAVMTTNLTRLIMDVIATVVGRKPAEVAAARHRAKHTWPVVVGFVVGASLGAACFGAAGMNALGLPIGLALVAAIARPAADITDGARE